MPTAFSCGFQHGNRHMVPAMLKAFRRARGVVFPAFSVGPVFAAARLLPWATNPEKSFKSKNCQLFVLSNFLPMKMVAAR